MVMPSVLDIDDSSDESVCEVVLVEAEVCDTILDFMFVETELVRPAFGDVEVELGLIALLSPCGSSELVSVVFIVENNVVDVGASVFRLDTKLDVGLGDEIVEETGTSTKSGVIDIPPASDGGTLSPNATTSCPVGSV